jgi:hypothetical protein
MKILKDVLAALDPTAIVTGTVLSQVFSRHAIRIDGGLTLFKARMPRGQRP